MTKTTRSIILGVRFTPAEQQALKDLSQQRGQNTSQLVRDLVLPAITGKPNYLQVLEARLELLEAAVEQSKGAGQ